MRKKILVLVLCIILLLSMVLLVKENQATILKWYKRQAIEFKLRVFKQHLINLQVEYGSEGALEA